jgi:hypothetical protein
MVASLKKHREQWRRPCMESSMELRILYQIAEPV